MAVITSTTLPEVAREVRPLMEELRPGLDADTYAALVAEPGVRALTAWDGDVPVGVAVHRVLASSRGRYLFAEDLVTTSARRGEGIAAQLFAELQRVAAAEGCVRIELDSGVTNATAHRFYFRHGMSMLAMHFSLPVGPAPSAGQPAPEPAPEPEQEA